MSLSSQLFLIESAHCRLRLTTREKKFLICMRRVENAITV